MRHDGSMTALASRSGPPIAETRAVVKLWSEWRVSAGDAELAGGLIGMREAGIDPLEGEFAQGLRRFDKSGEYAADGALDVVGWLRWKCKLSGKAAAERVTVSRQLEKLPETQKALASGEVGYQHVAVMAWTAEHIGTAAVRKEETALLRAAETMDPSQFNNHAKQLEHRVDAAGALAETNRAHARRYFCVSEPQDGLVRLDGLLDAEGGATLRTALNRLLPPSKDDDRTSGQRWADALIELCHRPGAKSSDGAGPRPQLVIRASIDTLAGTTGSPAGELEWGAPIPAETVRRLACDAALTRITSRGELDAETSRATRTIPPATRRALATRDRGCVAPGCGRPPDWTDAHHIKHWVHGGETTAANLVLLCRRHHRMVHEGGFRLQAVEGGRWALTPPYRREAHARSA